MSDEKFKGVYTFGPPTYVGKIPLRTDVTVLPADDPDQKPIGFSVNMRHGVEVYRFASDGSVDETPLRGYEDITDGTKLAVLGFSGGFHPMTVERSVSGFTASNENLSAILQFDTDDRHCWITTGLVNMRAIRSGMVELSSGESIVAREPLSCTACHDLAARSLRIQLAEVTAERDQAETKLLVAEHNNQILRDANACLQSETNDALTRLSIKCATQDIEIFGLRGSEINIINTITAMRDNSKLLLTKYRSSMQACDSRAERDHVRSTYEPEILSALDALIEKTSGL